MAKAYVFEVRMVPSEPGRTAAVSFNFDVQFVGDDVPRGGRLTISGQGVQAKLNDTLLAADYQAVIAAEVRAIAAANGITLDLLTGVMVPAMVDL